MPVVGTDVVVEFARAVVAQSTSAARCVIALVDGTDALTARPVTGLVPRVRPGTPCVVAYRVGGERLTVDAVTLRSNSKALVLQLKTVERRRAERYERAIGVKIDLRGGLGQIEGMTEDLSVGGLRARMNVALDPDRRVLVSISLGAAPPILAAAEVLSCASTGAGGSYVVRLEFTLISPQDEARLQEFLELPSVRSGHDEVGEARS